MKLLAGGAGGRSRLMTSKQLLPVHEPARPAIATGTP
jgi:hypothetical protein